MAFLDDLYIDTVPTRAREALDTTTQMVSDLCGIAELGGDRPLREQGVVVLGTPVGHPEFVRAWTGDRLQEERRLVTELPQLPDLQCAWLLLLFCASPRANHTLRTLPPTQAAPYAGA